MRFRLTFWTLLFVMVFAELTQAQSGPCTQSTIGHSRVPVADDAFSFMPPYGKPVIGKAAIGETDTKAFSDRTNVRSERVGEHRIVPSVSGDMAYEYGTIHMSSDSNGNPATGHGDFKADMLTPTKQRDCLSAGGAEDAAIGGKTATPK